MRQYDGLEPLSALLKQTDNNELLVAATGAIWKCSKDPENVKQYVCVCVCMCVCVWVCFDLSVLLRMQAKGVEDC